MRAAVRAAPAMLLVLILAFQSAHASVCCSGPERFWQRCVVNGRFADSIRVRLPDDTTTRTIVLNSIPLRNAARSLRRPNDALVFIGEVGGAKTLLAIGVRVGRELRLGIMLAVAGGLLALAALLLSG